MPWARRERPGRTRSGCASHPRMPDQTGCRPGGGWEAAVAVWGLTRNTRADASGAAAHRHASRMRPESLAPTLIAPWMSVAEGAARGVGRIWLSADTAAGCRLPEQDRLPGAEKQDACRDRSGAADAGRVVALPARGSWLLKARRVASTPARSSISRRYRARPVGRHGGHY